MVTNFLLEPSIKRQAQHEIWPIIEVSWNYYLVASFPMFGNPKMTIMRLLFYCPSTYLLSKRGYWMFLGTETQRRVLPRAFPALKSSVSRSLILCRFKQSQTNRLDSWCPYTSYHLCPARKYKKKEATKSLGEDRTPEAERKELLPSGC